jgi:putative inorganic carbon (hco3(-)) transporter
VTPASLRQRLPALAAGGLAVAVPLIAFGGPLLLAVPALVAALYLGTFVGAAGLVSLGIVALSLNGNASELGLPMGPDRLLFAAAIGALVVGLPLGAWATRRIRWRGIHLVLALVATGGIVSAAASGTLRQSEGIFALLDRLGIMPFVLFTIAPVVFATRRQRNLLLAALVGLGAYLSFTAFAETLGLRGLVFPQYVNDPDVGHHFGRARGPFVEAVAMGLGLFACAVASTIAWRTWHPVWARRLAAVVAVACLVSTILTLTRAVWLATAVAILVVLGVNPTTRRAVVPVAVTGAIAAFAALTFIPGLGDRAEDRAADQRPVWDRFNTNEAAIRAVVDRPLTGVGWQQFRSENAPYLWQADDRPLTGSRIEVHNVFLSHAAELGLPIAGLWATAMVVAVGGAVIRPGPSSLRLWRLGLLALGLHWAIVAAFGPLGYPLPNALLWLWAGITARDHLSEPLTTPDIDFPLEETPAWSSTTS